jgi:hypothetical protein
VVLAVSEFLGMLGLASRIVEDTDEPMLVKNSVQ